MKSNFMEIFKTVQNKEKKWAKQETVDIDLF